MRTVLILRQDIRGSWTSFSSYRVVQHNFTLEIVFVFHMLFSRSLSNFSMTSLRQHVAYFNFRSSIQLDHPVQWCHVLQLEWSECETLFWPRCIGDCEEQGRWEILLPAQVPWTGPWQGHQVEAEWQSPYSDKLVSTGCPKFSVSTLTTHISVIQRVVNLFELSWEKISARLQPATAGHARLVLNKQLEQIYTPL